MSSDLAHLKDLWAEVQMLRRRLSELEHDDTALTTLALRDGVTAPTAVATLALIYVDTSTGDLMVRFGDGITKVLATDT